MKANRIWPFLTEVFHETFKYEGYQQTDLHENSLFNVMCNKSGGIFYRLTEKSTNVVNGLLKCCNWMINTRPCIFEYEMRYAKILLPFLESAQADRNRAIARHQRVNAWKKKGNKFPPKTRRCEESILAEILESKDVKLSPYDPKIGIELEVENLATYSYSSGYCDDPDCDCCDCGDEEEYCLNIDWSRVSPEIWEAKDDGTLSERGKELVCKPLEVNEALDEFDKLVNYLRRSTEAEGCDNCGLHFHIGMHPEERGLDPWKDEYLLEIQEEILDFIKRNQGDESFDHLFLKSRYGNRHCEVKPSTPFDRYRAVNFHALRSHGTIEIRFCGVHPCLSERWVLQFKHFVKWVYNLFYPNMANFDYEPLTYCLEQKLALIGGE